jgi:hypothetical protein
MAKKKWSDLSRRARRTLIAVGAGEGLLEVAALVDLARRPAAEVRGSKVRWALAVTLVNSVGLVPVAYFVYGRRRG